MHASTEFSSCNSVVNDQPAKRQYLPAYSAAGFVQPRAVWDPRPPLLTSMKTLITEFHKPALRRASLPILVSPNHDGVEHDWNFVFKQAQMLVKLPLGKRRLCRLSGFKKCKLQQNTWACEPEKENCEARRTSPLCTLNDRGAVTARTRATPHSETLGFPERPICNTLEFVPLAWAF